MSFTQSTHDLDIFAKPLLTVLLTTSNNNNTKCRPIEIDRLLEIWLDVRRVIGRKARIRDRRESECEATTRTKPITSTTTVATVRGASDWTNVGECVWNCTRSCDVSEKRELSSSTSSSSSSKCEICPSDSWTRGSMRREAVEEASFEDNSPPPHPSVLPPGYVPTTPTTTTTTTTNTHTHTDTTVESSETDLLILTGSLNTYFHLLEELRVMISRMYSPDHNHHSQHEQQQRISHTNTDPGPPPEYTPTSDANLKSKSHPRTNIKCKSNSKSSLCGPEKGHRSRYDFLRLFFCFGGRGEENRRWSNTGSIGDCCHWREYPDWQSDVESVVERFRVIRVALGAIFRTDGDRG